MEPQYARPQRVYSTPQVKMPAQATTAAPGQAAESERGSAELRVLDCNLTSLCEHILVEGFNSGSFSDIVVHAMGSTYHLHRLILSRSSYFRNMLHGPWREASLPVVTLNVDDNNVNAEAIAIALAYLYGHHPKLNDNNAFRVLAAASFLDLQDLCAICTDFIISELWTSNFLTYQVFAESQDYGIHGERVRTACWGYLCQSGARELKEVLSKLSSHTLHALLTSDELWVPNEEKRFELALYTLLSKGAGCRSEHPEQVSSSGSATTMGMYPESSKVKGKNVIDGSADKKVHSEIGSLRLRDTEEKHLAHELLADLSDSKVVFQAGLSNSKQEMHQGSCTRSNSDSTYLSNMELCSPINNALPEISSLRTSCSYVEVPVGVETIGYGGTEAAMEGPSEEGPYNLNKNNWLSGEQPRHFNSLDPSCDGLMLNDWGRCGIPSLSWGGRVVGRREAKCYAKGNLGVREEEYDTFVNIFEEGSLLYCNMSFEALLNVRRQLEELDFPGKAVNDGLWLQMLLSQRVQEIGADTCRICCLTSAACACMQQYGFSQRVSNYYMQEHEDANSPDSMGNVYVADSSQGEGNGLFRPVRVQVRGPIDGLAGIGRGNTFVTDAAWPPTRFVFSRVPFNMGNRSSQQFVASDDSERPDHNGNLSGDGLTALVGLSQGGSNGPNVHGEQIARGYDTDVQDRFSGLSIVSSSASGIPVQMLESAEHAVGIEWNANSSTISLDINTPLCHFPPFRFGVEFEDVHRLSDGQVKHSSEFFYAGSLWKVSVQAFNDEDPQGRRTLGLFLHRRKAEVTDSLRKAHMYVDSREKVKARYQLICPSKRQVRVFGRFKQRGTLLPKAPKGWGWRTALLFDELGDLLQNGTLRVAAVVQLI